MKVSLFCKRIIWVLLLISPLVFSNKIRLYAGEKTPVKLSYSFDWKIPAQNAGYFVALSKGFYKDEGLDVTLSDGSGALLNLKLIGTGKMFMAASQAPQIVKARADGIPVVSVAVLLQYKGDIILSLEEKGIKLPSDLVDKKVGVLFGTSLEDTYKALLAKAGIQRKEVQEVQAMGGVRSALLLTNKVDALTTGYFSSDLYGVEKSGKRPGVMDVRDFGIEWYSNVIAVHEDFIKNNPDLIRRFVRASLKGWEYIPQHQDETVQIIMKYRPETDKEYLKWSIGQIVPLLTNKDTERFCFGIQTGERWDKMQEDLFTSGYTQKKVPATEFFTNDFLPEYKK